MGVYRCFAGHSHRSAVGRDKCRDRGLPKNRLVERLRSFAGAFGHRSTTAYPETQEATR